MSERMEERVLGRCEAFLTYSKRGIRFRDGEIIYVASVDSIKALIEGKTEKIYFAKFPYRKIPLSSEERDCVATRCEKCGKTTIWRKIREDMWQCEGCSMTKSTTELIKGIRQLVEGY
ncbi:hypothetical protein DRO54_10430 [Candidatus Bathyarchaeota archaeon]|nr:MAG: hypothetical protein DRO54_10430 [Candidatus Bathyarchaeota archaeon]